MKRKERYIARLDEVNITREDDSAVIQYKEPQIIPTQLKIGPEIASMSDEAILGLFNDTLRAQARLAAEYKHVAVEVPLGSPQIKYFARGCQWSPRGGVLRCLVEDDENGQLVVGIDDKELTLEEFGRMLFTQRLAFHFQRPALLGSPRFLGDLLRIGPLAHDDPIWKKWSLEPIEIVDGVPFAIVTGYDYSGSWDSSVIESYVRYCINNCDWSNIRFATKSKKQKEFALEKFFSSRKWERPLGTWEKEFLAKQIE